MTNATGVTNQWLVNQAMSWLGVPYEWAGNSRSGIDCSGLVQQVFAAAGIQLPRVTYEQIGVGVGVQINQLRPGDLVFFDTDAKRKGPDHVGIYIGQGKFIHAPHPGDKVKISSITDSYYANRWMGGRRVNGVITSDDYAADVAQAPEVRLSKAELAERYGMSYAFLKSDPELWKLSNSAVEGQWGEKRFTAELKNTNWWKTNSKAMREAQILAKTDPASYKAALGAAEAAIQAQAVKVGAILSSKEAQKLAKKAVTLGLNAAQLNNILGQYVKFNDEHVLGGQAGAAAQSIQQFAYENGIKTTDESTKNQAAYIVRGISTMEKAQAQIRQAAMGAYPGFADQIAAGATVRDLAQPYIQTVAQELGLPETEVDVWHPKVKAALNRADAKGNPAPMSLSDFRTSVRDDPAWRKTDGAINNVMNVGRQVLRDFGLVR